MATNRSGSRRGLIIGLVIVLVLALGAGAYFVFFNKSNDADVAEGTPSTSASPNENGVIDPIVVAGTSAIQPLTPGDTVPTAAGVSAAIGPILPEFGNAPFNAYIADAATGTPLFDQNSSKALPPASTAKLLLAAAVLNTLDPQSRLTTKVVQGASPGEIVFVGGGDVTLASTSTTDTVYKGAASVTALADQIKALGITPTKIIVDTSYWADDTFAPGWVTEDIGDGTHTGYITNMVPLMVDGDRLRPNLIATVRSGDPAALAGKALALALGNPSMPVEPGVAPANAAVLASVESQPISVLLTQALVNSDNVLAEALGRQLALAEGVPATFGGAVSAIQLNLQVKLGLNTAGMTLSDVSGLSTLDRVPPKLLADVLALASQPDSKLADLILGLPVAGATGTLADRYLTPETGSAARGWLRAKTGSLTLNNNTTYALAGIVPDADGRLIVFSIIIDSVLDSSTRVLMDRVAATLRTCGCTG